MRVARVSAADLWIFFDLGQVGDRPSSRLIPGGASIRAKKLFIDLLPPEKLPRNWRSINPAIIGAGFLMELGGATKCFEAPFVNDLWMPDFSPGPFLHPADGAKAIPTFLCVIIADHSRLIPYAAYYLRPTPRPSIKPSKKRCAAAA